MKKIIIYSLGIIIITASLAVIIYAFSPIFLYQINSEKLPYHSKLYPEKKHQNEELPHENKLVIPKIGINVNIVEGKDENALWSGAWRYPNSAKPGEEGNIVISGHRFQFKPPNNKTFYLLDKLKEGDYIIIYWEREEHDYEVKNIFEVEPGQVEILERGDEEKLTLYTCTPLFRQDRRLIIEAHEK